MAMTEEAVYSVNLSATARDIWSRTQGDNWDLDDTPRGSLFDQAAIAVWKDFSPILLWGKVVVAPPHLSEARRQQQLCIPSLYDV